MKTKLFFLLFILITTITACNQKEDNSEATKKTEYQDIQAEDIGRLHNEYLKRFYAETRSHDSNKKDINISDVIAFLEKQPELQEVPKETFNTITIFFTDFKNSDTYNLKSPENFVHYIKSATKNNSRIRNYSSKTNLNEKEVESIVMDYSREFWTNIYGKKETRSKGSVVIAADGAGAAWGLFFSPLGSIIAGTAASILVNEIDNINDYQPVDIINK